jgi:hypothetical protein
MSIDFEKKFRTSELDTSDCLLLLQQIEENNSPGKLLSLIYIYGRSCKEHPSIVKLCNNYIENPVPGLTAVCMKVLIDYWGYWQDNFQVLERYLDMDVFDEWYDEVIFSVSYISRNRGMPFPESVLNKFMDIKDDPELSELFGPS